MSTTPNGNVYYPLISDLINVDSLPEILSFIKGDLENILDNTFYKDFQSSKSFDGSSAFYDLSIIAAQKLSVEIPGTGLSLVLNPDYNNQTISSFQVRVFWQWKILKFLREFNALKYSLNGGDLFYLALDMFDVSETQAVNIAISVLVKITEIYSSKFEQFVSDINTLYSSNIQVTEESINPVDDLILQLKSLGKDVFVTIYTLYLSPHPDRLIQNINDFFSIFIPKDLGAYIADLIIPQAQVTLELNAALEFPRNVLVPMIRDDEDNFSVDDSTDADGNLKTAYVQFADITLNLDTETGFTYSADFEGTLYPEYTQIGNTGIIVSFTGVKLDLSRTSNIPEADAAGYPVDFVGAYAKEVSVILTKLGTDGGGNASLTAENLLIGTGGVSGTIKLDASSGLLRRNLGEFVIELDEFSLTLRQNAIVDTSISGMLILPSQFNDENGPRRIAIDVAIKDDGNFSITARPSSPDLLSFTLPEVFTMTISSLQLGEKDHHFFLALQGSLTFITDIPLLKGALPAGIIINKFVLWDTGKMEFDGGGLVIPKAFRLSVGPVKMEISHLSLGTWSGLVDGEQRNCYYFGFDGMINTGAAGLEAAGNGIKFYFTYDGGPVKTFLRIDSLEIDITIPENAAKANAAFILQGYLSMKNPEGSGSAANTEYMGRVTVDIPKLRLSGSAAMRLMPEVPAFLVDLGLELSSPIPLGGTGLGIYGFRGLFGKHYLPSKSATTPPLDDQATWWQYYKVKSTVPPFREGIEFDKFASEPGVSMGAGLSIATAFDSGFVFSSKLFVLLGLPNVFLIQGQAGIIRKRLGLLDTSDPPFSAFIVLSDHSFQGNLAVNYNLPDSGSFKGDILSLQAQLDVGFFFNNASAWYLNIGKDTPATAQVQAKILSLFKGHAYLMISSQGIKAGAGVSFAFAKKFGPVAVDFGAYLDMGAAISFKPVQIGGFIAVGGHASLRVWKVGIYLSLDFKLFVEAPHPFSIVGGLIVQIKVAWFLKIKVPLQLSWRINSDNRPLKVPISVLDISNSNTGYLPASAKNMLTNEVFTLNYVPMKSGTIPPPGQIWVEPPAGSDPDQTGTPGWEFDFTSADAQYVTIPLDSFIDIELLKPVSPKTDRLGAAGNQVPDGYVEYLPPTRGLSPQIRHQFQLNSVNVFAWNGTSWQPYSIYKAVTEIVNNNTGPNHINDLDTLKIGYWQFNEKNRYNKFRLMSQNMFSYLNSTLSDHVDLDALNFRSKDVFCYDNLKQEHIVNWIGYPLGQGFGNGPTWDYKRLKLNFSNIENVVTAAGGGGSETLDLDGNSGLVTIDFLEPVLVAKLKITDNTNNIQIRYLQKTYTADNHGKAMPAYTTIATGSISREQHDLETNDQLVGSVDRIQLVILPSLELDYTGHWNVGSHFEVTDPTGLSASPSIESQRSFAFLTLYNQGFTSAEVFNLEFDQHPGAVGQWSVGSLYFGQPIIGNDIGYLSGQLVPGNVLRTNRPYLIYSDRNIMFADDDGFILPDDPGLNLENGSFSFDVTVIFEPLVTDFMTVLSKVATGDDGLKKGFVLQMRNLLTDPAEVFNLNSDSLPEAEFNLYFYDSTPDYVSKITARCKLTMDCETGRVYSRQYKRIFISVNRDLNKLDIYIDKLLAYSGEIPDSFGIYQPVMNPVTRLKQIMYVTANDQERMIENGSSPAALANEVQIMSDTLGKTLQPLWRPDTIYAVVVDTSDTVEKNAPVHEQHIFGFKTAGPVGHFHQQNSVYLELKNKDQAQAFKLASLQTYINQDRSFPDPLGRYNLSKPVLYKSPQMQLVFQQDYMDIMFANWDSYQGLPAIISQLNILLHDPAGNVITKSLEWDYLNLPDIDLDNYRTLPRDRQIMYLLNRAANAGGCNPLSQELQHKLKVGRFAFPDLQPNALYTAVFSTTYQHGAQVEETEEVHRFSFKTSLYGDFGEQVRSLVLEDAGAVKKFAAYSLPVSFQQAYIDSVLKPLVNNDSVEDLDFVLQYAVVYERVIYGGLHLPAPELTAHSMMRLIINEDPNTHVRKLLAIWIYNPEAFNEPKLPADDLADTIQLTLTQAGGATTYPYQFVYHYSRDNSGVLITNPEMNMPIGEATLLFQYKKFNGQHFESEPENQITIPSIDLAPYFNL